MDKLNSAQPYNNTFLTKCQIEHEVNGLDLRNIFVVNKASVKCWKNSNASEIRAVFSKRRFLLEYCIKTHHTPDIDPDRVKFVFGHSERSF